MEKLTEILIKCRMTRMISNQMMLKIIKLSLKSADLETDTLKLLKKEWKSVKFDEFLPLFTSQKINSIQAINYLSPEYPDLLKEIYNPPALLFYRGDIDLLKNDNLAIVGSRLASDYAYNCISGLVPKVIDRYTIVSGLAKGVDAWSHQRTLQTGGKTIAVIGSCLEDYYPRENRSLQEEISRSGLLISEYPPGCHIARWHFPQRNRIIAGISKKVIVVEAKERSGALITADMALEDNRDVYAIPGRIDSSLSKGCNKLIQEGAIPLINFNEL